MGCKNSVPVQTSPAIQKMVDRPGNRSGAPPIMSNSMEIDPLELMKYDLRSVTNGVVLIPNVATWSPIMCLSELSTPVLIMPASFSGNLYPQISLPTMALSRCQFGRVLAIGSMEVIEKCEPVNESYVIFLENILRWTAGPQPQSRIMLVLGIKKSHAMNMIKNMNGLGFGFEHKTSVTGEIDLTKYCGLIIQSDCQLTDKIYDFVVNGGGLLIFPTIHHSKHKYSINTVITQFGLAFPNFPFYIEPTKDDSVSAQFPFHEIRQYTLSAIISTFCSTLNKKTIDMNAIDRLGTLLRYHLVMVQRGQCSELQKLAESCLEYLTHRSYYQDNMICSEPVDEMIGILMSESLLKMSANSLGYFNLGSIFPGNTIMLDLEEITVNLNITDNRWNSTGVWIPANCIATAVISKLIPNIVVQVGAHSSYICKRGPWKRWPSVSSSFDVGQNNFDIATPYGGMIYVINFDKEITKSIKLSITFPDVIKYPYYKIDKPKLWKKTQGNPIPWGEVEGNNIIFTALTRNIREIKNLDEFANTMDLFITDIRSFISNQETWKLRVVFDVEVPEEGHIVGYPIVMSLDECPNIFKYDDPSKEIFTLLYLISMTLLPRGLFDPMIEVIISCSAAASCFMNKWPMYNPLDYLPFAPTQTMTDFMNIIKTNGIQVIQASLSSVVEQFTKRNTTTIENFRTLIQEMSSRAKKDYSYIIMHNVSPSVSCHLTGSLSSATDQEWFDLDVHPH